METIYLAAGCFWGVEHKLAQVPGVTQTEVGYMNGRTENPTYKEVCADDTGHAEAVKVVFDNKTITLEELLRHFWKLHDPTTLNRQGPDAGTQYRSGIFYCDEDQRKVAEISKEEAQNWTDSKIVTELVPAGKFYPAEEYHQKYFVKNGGSCGI
ncbi:MAG: peptide-methionine (S)-S-oxide reductase [Bdellovibrionaceae bacterium]|nr:peptide-methionine (S)-S-oxide reductase [Pseudobdellovibrionaceae bacterium]|tara:strand:+ start:142 stop:603 length:462 start_codon:yes stop_codon:yes gene_type:complete